MATLAVWCVLVTVLAVAGLVNAKVVVQYFEVAYINAAPDCYSKTIIGINGNYPGPEIRAMQGDTVKVNFTNHLATEGITMHWHGIRQLFLEVQSCDFRCSSPRGCSSPPGDNLIGKSSTGHLPHSLSLDCKLLPFELRSRDEASLQNASLSGFTVDSDIPTEIIASLVIAANTGGSAVHQLAMPKRLSSPLSPNIGSPWADGTAAVSQCAINYGETFTYEFVVDRPGTYFYHGHFGCQRAAGFYGSLIVDLPSGLYEPYHYDGEHMIILNDWWHKPVADQEQGLESTAFKWVGEPQSLLLEGRGWYNCSNVPNYKPAGISCNQTDTRCSPHVMYVERGKTYRLRLASVASLSSLNFKIEGHMMTVVEADGHNVEPFDTDNLDLYSGETYSVLVKADQPGDNYHLGLNVRGREDQFTPTGLGILNYNNNNVQTPNTPAPKGPAWNDFEASKALARRYKKLMNNPDPTSHPFNRNDTVTRTLVLLTTQNYKNGHYKWAINNITYVPLQTPLLAGLVYNISGAYDTNPPADYYNGPYDIYNVPTYTETAEGSGVYMFNTGDVVDIIIQNANTLTPNKSEIHPWHLHGHDFYILAYGDGEYDPVKSPFTFNLDNPPERNNVPVFPYGWTAVRTKLTNPGAWPFHCHVEWHFHLGMGVMFAHGIDQVRAKGIPSSTVGCGLTKQFFKP